MNDAITTLPSASSWRRLSTAERPRFRQSEGVSTRHRDLVKPRLTAPLVLLSEEAMESLYDEQQRHPRSVETPKKPVKKVVLYELQDEPRGSSDSHPCTSTSSSTLSSLHPEEYDIEDDLEATRLLFENSMRLDSMASCVLPAMRECQVCYEQMEAIKAHCCSSCRGSFCANCMRWYIEYKIVEGEVSDKKLVCPAPQCNTPLTQDFVKSLVSDELFEKYLQYRENQKPGVRFCPRPGCCARIDEPAFSRSRRVACTSCHEESCMKCGDVFHLVPGCRRKERRYGKWRKRSNVRRCPKCRSDIEKQGGCAHMKCFQCDAEFCWSCLRPWDTHDETLCMPLTFLKSKSRKFGPNKPVRVVTKSVVVGAATVAAVTGVGVAAVVLPPVLLYHWAKTSRRSRRRKSLTSDMFIIE